MNNRAIRTFFLLAALLLELGSQMAFAQENEQMFIYQVEGKNYTKKSFNKKGDLKSSQIFKVGKVEKEKDQYSMLLKVYAYNEKGVLEDSAETKYTCKPSAKRVLMTVFPFAEFNTNKTVKIELADENISYPDTWTLGMEMADISFSLTLEGGVLGAFGTSSKNQIYNRIISSQDTLENTYTISSLVRVEAYMFGFRLDTIEFTVEETVHPQKGIIKQYFKESNGEYFTINLQ